MKQIKFSLLIAIAMVAISTNSNAQTFYTKIKGGYGWGTNKFGYLPEDGRGIIQPDYEETIWASLGQGGQFQFSGGYFFNNHFAVEVDFTYLHGKETTLLDMYQSKDINIPGFPAYTVEANAHASAYTRQYRLSPTILISTGRDKIVSGYAKFGLTLPLGGYTMVSTTGSIPQTNDFDIPTGENDDVAIDEKITGRPTIGFKGAFGIEYKVTSQIGLFTEVEASFLNIKRNAGEKVKYELNGTNMIPNLPYSSIHTNYVEKLSVSDDAQDPEKASEALTSSSPFSTVGINAGLTFYF